MQGLGVGAEREEKPLSQEAAVLGNLWPVPPSPAQPPCSAQLANPGAWAEWEDTGHGVDVVVTWAGLGQRLKWRDMS